LRSGTAKGEGRRPNGGWAEIIREKGEKKAAIGIEDRESLASMKNAVGEETQGALRKRKTKRGAGRRLRKRTQRGKNEGGMFQEGAGKGWPIGPTSLNADNY